MKRMETKHCRFHTKTDIIMTRFTKYGEYWKDLFDQSLLDIHYLIQLIQISGAYKGGRGTHIKNNLNLTFSLN